MIAFLVLCLLALLLLEVPVGLALGGSAILAMLLFNPDLLQVAPIKMYSTLTNFVLLSIPLFVLAGNVAVVGGIADGLSQAAFRLARRLPGGVTGGIVPVGMFFAGITGSSAADVAAMGTFVSPGLVAQGYSPRTVNGTIAATATLGILLPPSLTLILYSAIAQTSATQLFLAGLIPGVLVAILLFAIALNRGARDQRGRASADVYGPLRRRDLWRILWAIPMPAILIVGIYGGVLTVSEVSAAAVVYGLAVSLLMFRYRDWRGLAGAFERSFDTTVMLLTLFVGASLFAFVVTQSGVPGALTAMIDESHLPVVVVLLLVNVLLLVMGSAMESLSVLLIMVPILLPLMQRLGVDTVQTGILVAVNIELGVLLPPFGINLLTLASVGRTPVNELFRGVVPYLPVVVFNLLIVTFWAPASHWLPSVVHLGVH